MRIAIVIHSLHGGGAERVASTLANSWVERGHEVTVITFAGGVDAYPLQPSVRRVSLGMAAESRSVWAAISSNRARLRSLRRAIVSSNAEIVLALMPAPVVLSWFATLGLAARVVASERSFPPRLPLGRGWEFLRRRVYPKASVVVSLTSKGGDWIVENCPGSRSAVIPNPVTWPLPSGEPRVAPDSVVPGEARLVLAAGRLAKEKGFHRLLDAFERVARCFPNWSLAIVGEGPERLDLLERARRLGIAQRVYLPGRVGNVQDWYERADLFAMSSDFEGFPNVLVEAMACGCPVVSFDCDTGPRDIVRHGTDGLLVSPEEGVEGLSAGLAALMADDSRRKAMGESATAVRSRFSLGAVADRWEKLFAEVCEQPGTR